MKSRRDVMILDFSHAHTQILKGWHGLRQTNDTPSGLVKHRIRIYNHPTPSEFLLGRSSFDRILGLRLEARRRFPEYALG